MRRVPVVVTVLGLAASGCGFSSVEPDSSVSISGRALDASGKPLAKARVLLVRQADVGQVIFGSILTVGTLSAICFAPDPPAICDKARVTTADAEGRYRFDVKGSDTQGSLGTAATMNVVFSGRSAKTSTTVSFTTKNNTVSVPDARLWNLAAEVSRDGNGIRLSWRPLSRSAGSKATYSAQLYDVRTGAALWTQAASGGQAEIDPRIAEDVRGSVAVSAGTQLSGGSGVADARASYLSPRLPVAASAGAPPSRGRPCAAVTGTAPAAVEPRMRCAATDGDLTRPAHLGAGGDPTVSGVVVDLGRVRPVDLVVARGFSGQFLLEISTDGRAYRTVATGFGQAWANRPAGRPSARYVRLRSPAGLDESLSSELSVW